MYHGRIEAWMDSCYPYRVIRRRSNEAPWITNAIRKKMRIRLRVFLREGRSEKWKRINKEIQKMIIYSQKEMFFTLLEHAKCFQAETVPYS